VIDGSSTGFPERSEPGVTRSRHISGQRQVSWDLLRSGFVLLVVAYHATYVAPVIHPELAPRPFSFSHQVGASLLLVVSAYFAGALAMRTPNAAQGATLRRPLAVVVVAAGLALAGCANPTNAPANPTNAPGASSTAPSPPVPSATPPAQPQAAALTWAKSMCQALHPALRQLGSPPEPDLNNTAATRQAYISYLGSARNATNQAIDRLVSIGPPPVQNGLQILGQMSTQLGQLRDNLNDASAQLSQANPNDSAAMGRAFGAASHVVGLFGTLAADPQLRAAIDQTPECQNLTG
jgi:hypothetical protein